MEAGLFEVAVHVLLVWQMDVLSDRRNECGHVFNGMHRPSDPRYLHFNPLY